MGPIEVNNPGLAVVLLFANEEVAQVQVAVS